MADEKWIDDLHAKMAVSDAAKKVLSLRLGVVRERLPCAVFHSEEDVEHVHQLRVGTRRAAAALSHLSDYLPVRLLKKTRNSLRALRRSAGEARDWDVFLEFLQKRLTKVAAKQRRGLEFLLGFAHGHRVLAQEHLVQAHEANADKFARCIDRIAQELGAAQQADATFGELATPILTKSLRELETAAHGDLQDYGALHQVRILGKQLRYAMEIFESCFAPEFRHRFYAAVVDMQEILGLANDSHVARQQLNALKIRLMRTQSKQWPHFQEGIEALLRFHDRRLPEQRRKFEKWWQQWLTSGTEQAFAEMIQGR